MAGWVKLWRKTQRSNMVRSLNSKQRDVMTQCLLLANHDGNSWEWNGEIITCEPGQFVTSLENLKKVCANDVSIQNVRTALLKLEKWEFLTNKSTKTGRLITIKKWHTYQADKDSDQQSNQQTSNKELTTNKNEEEKNSLPEKIFLFAQRFYEHLHQAYPEKKIKTTNGKVKRGAQTVEQLIRLDKYDLDNDIRPALQWGLQDEFWNAQLNSLAELRKKKSGAENHKFDNLYQRYISNKPKQKLVDLEY